MQSSIQQQITAQKQQKALSEFVKNFRKKWEGRTECRAEYSVQDCKGYKAPATPRRPPSGTASTADRRPAADVADRRLAPAKK